MLPADAKGPVPVMIMFRPGQRSRRRWAGPRRRRPGVRRLRHRRHPGSDAPATEQLIVDGWGFAFLNPASIQADNGAGLTKGIIGLVNKGQPRKPDDWGALRAWAWGASRALDYLETESRREREAGRHRRRVALRQGRARDAWRSTSASPLVLIGSSGEGGAKLHRRNWGEAVENLTGSR